MQDLFPREFNSLKVLYNRQHKKKPQRYEDSRRGGYETGDVQGLKHG